MIGNYFFSMNCTTNTLASPIRVFVIISNLMIYYISVTGYKKWSSQFKLQFKQLQIFALKQFQASAGFEPMTSAMPGQVLN